VSRKTPQNVKGSAPATLAFAQRLRAAFDNARDAEIARRLGYRSQSPIAKWFNGEAYPNAEVLLRIAQITERNLHWLLTGEGDPRADSLQFLGDPILTVLRQMEELKQIPIEELVRFLVRESLLARGSELMQRLDALEPDELVELRALVSLFTEDPNLAAQAVANLRRRA
jgi:transcriptional regulator with XRE-family HTH domain